MNWRERFFEWKLSLEVAAKALSLFIDLGLLDEGKKPHFNPESNVRILENNLRYYRVLPDPDYAVNAYVIEWAAYEVCEKHGLL